jgi:DNA repair photolyase
MNYIGMTEAGDAGWNLSWYEKLTSDDSVYAGAILITKNAANPRFAEKVLELIKTKPCIIHAGVTGWGGSAMEPGIKDPETTIKALRKLIDDGFPAKNIVLRIDPIIPTEEGLEKAGYVLRLARIHIPDVKRIRISIYDDYHKAREEMCRRGFAPIDDITKWKNEMERRPSPEQVNAVAETCLEYAHPDQIFELCAEPELAAAYPDRFTWSGCLSRKDCEIMNIEVPEHIGINGQNRYGCRCLKMKKELLSSKRRCPTNCAYCYWGRN